MMSELSHSLMDYLKAIRDYKKADECCTEDAGYWLRDEMFRVSEAEDRFISALQNRLTDLAAK